MDEEAGAAEVDLVGGDQGDDFVEGVLELATAGGKRQVEGLASDAAVSATGAIRVAVGIGSARGVMVVAERLTKKGGGAAEMGGSGRRGRDKVGAKGADVLVTVVGLDWVIHGIDPPKVLLLSKSSWRRV